LVLGVEQCWNDRGVGGISKHTLDAQTY